jgi:preprotein translocase subunit SecA
MNEKNYFKMNKYFLKLEHYLNNLRGIKIELGIAKYKKIINKIRAVSFAGLTSEQLQQKSFQFKEKVKNNIPLDDILIEAFALVNEVIQRVLKIKPYDVQLIAAYVLHQGKIAEMQTGEGKTLAAVFPAYLNALSGKGVHILTANSYLAKRDSEWMKPIYEFLGLKAGHIQENMTAEERKKVYQNDITYLTAKEAGFDYLKDCLAYNIDEIMQREYN